MRSVRKRFRQAAATRLICSGRLLVPPRRSPVSRSTSKPNFVAITTLSRIGWSASPSSSSFANGPYDRECGFASLLLPGFRPLPVYKTLHLSRIISALASALSWRASMVEAGACWSSTLRACGAVGGFWTWCYFRLFFVSSAARLGFLSLRGSCAPIAAGLSVYSAGSWRELRRLSQRVAAC